MTDQPSLDVTVSRVIAADAAAIWAALTDVTRLSEFSPETVNAAWVDDARGVGARFKGRNRIGWLRWTTVATVTARDEDRRFAFDTSPPSRSHWSYELEPVEGGTLVTESMTKDDPQPAPIRIMMRMVGVSDRAAHLRDGMTTTLERLAAATTEAAGPALPGGR